MGTKKKYSPVFKTKVALSVIREEGTLSELLGRYGVNANMISKWKKQALDNMNSAFTGKHERGEVPN
ncbi:transposase [Candidatus Bandiella numerosa]|uniref:transposase n=1 Tax=Candidatus Bandiella numerosa TaxID=2570586 RepID=UPI00249EEB22|nr:transposase [Candidatus Bandiella numerosa]WHA04444.1 transposase [Candidatus Bandiella numerosa]